MTDWILELTDKERESFLAFAKQSSSPIQIYLYSRILPSLRQTIIESNSDLPVFPFHGLYG
jgi:hypothetical protein